MARPRRPRICVDCHRPETADRPLSTRYLHTECAIERMAESARAINAREGQPFAKWVDGLTRAAENAQRQLQSQ